MIILHQYPAIWGLTSLSPFCIKVEFFLRAAKLPYKNQVEFNPDRGPKGKMPFIKLGNETVTDSSFIIERLISQYRLDELDIQDQLIKARALALKNMIEESLYYSLLYSRWIDPKGYAAISKEFKPLFPKPFGSLALKLIRRSLLKQAMAQGVARHTAEEVYAMGKNQIGALAVLLGDNKFFFADRLTYIDATVYAFLITILRQPFDSPLRSELLLHGNLLDYLERLHME